MQISFTIIFFVFGCFFDFLWPVMLPRVVVADITCGSGCQRQIRLMSDKHVILLLFLKFSEQGVSE